MAVILAAAPVRAGTLHIDAAGLPCNDRGTATEIAQRIADLMATQPNLTLEIRAPARDTLELVLSGPDGSTRRELAFHSADCPAMAQTVSLLLRGWIGRRWQHPAPQESLHEQPTDSRDRVAVTAEPNEAVLEAKAFAPSEKGRLALLVGAETLGASLDHAGPAVRVAADWDAKPPLGVSLLLGLDLPSEASPGRGSIAVKIWEVALAGRWSRPIGERHRLDLLAGAGIDVVAATSEGYRVVRADTLTLPALVLGARWRAQLGAAVSAMAGAELALRSRGHLFAVRNLEGGFAVSAASIRLLVGLAWEGAAISPATAASAGATAVNERAMDGLALVRNRE